MKLCGKWEHTHWRRNKKIQLVIKFFDSSTFYVCAVMRHTADHAQRASLHLLEEWLKSVKKQDVDSDAGRKKGHARERSIRALVLGAVERSRGQRQRVLNCSAVEGDMYKKAHIRRTSLACVEQPCYTASCTHYSTTSAVETITVIVTTLAARLLAHFALHLGHLPGHLPVFFPKLFLPSDLSAPLYAVRLLAIHYLLHTALYTSANPCF